MSQVPCPTCGEAVPCGGAVAGQEVRCPRCGRTCRVEEAPRPKRRRPRVRTLVWGAALFVGGLGIGFALGEAQGRQAAGGEGNGLTLRAFSFFGIARNEVRIEESKTQPAPPKAPKAR